MNEVARCAQIAAGAAATTAGPVALVDLGTGAGLGLHLDRYQYQIGDRRTGPAGAPITLHCELRGSRPGPATPGLGTPVLATTAPAAPGSARGVPSIAARVGIELHPVDLADPAEVAWLQACAPPEAAALTRLTTATAVARAHPARIVAGDVVDQLPGVLATLPADLPVLVVDAYLAVFLPSGRLRALTVMLADAGRTRPVTWLSLDPLMPLGPSGRDSVQGLDLPAWLVSGLSAARRVRRAGREDVRPGGGRPAPARPRAPLRPVDGVAGLTHHAAARAMMPAGAWPRARAAFTSPAMRAGSSRIWRGVTCRTRIPAAVIWRCRRVVCCQSSTA